jgi:hypothetical protein
MLNFPDAPSVGQKFSPGAGLPIYGWDGIKWITFTPELASKVAPSNSNPVMDGVAGAGSANAYARGDHVHPTDTTRAPINNAAFTGTLTASFLTVLGNVSIVGRLISTAKGHQFGGARGTSAGGGVLPSDANIKFYDHSGANGSWSGIGSDGSGHVWVRTGYSGNPVPVFFVLNDQTMYFRESPVLLTPGAGDNSTKVATTAFVMARKPTNMYPLDSSATVTGNVNIANADLWIHRNDTYGVLYLGNTGSRYLIYDTANYSFSGAHVFAANGRLYGTGDWGSAPYNNARLAYIGDVNINYQGGLQEPYGGSARTGGTGPTGGGGGNSWTLRFRQFQYYTTSWFAIGYA